MLKLLSVRGNLNIIEIRIRNYHVVEQGEEFETNDLETNLSSGMHSVVLDNIMHVFFAVVCFLSFRLHVLAGVYPRNVDKTDNKLAALWEETYIRNMRYAAQRLQEVRQ